MQTKNPVTRAFLHRLEPSIARFDVRRVVPYSAGRHVEGDLLVLPQALVAIAFNR